VEAQQVLAAGLESDLSLQLKLDAINLFFCGVQVDRMQGTNAAQRYGVAFSTHLLKFSISNERYYHGHGVPEDRVARLHDAASSRDI
jgi:hypothetical protein